MLFGPKTLPELREDMMLVISSLSVGYRNLVLLVSFERQTEKCLSEYFMLFFCSFGYRGKVIIKVIWSIIGIGCSITIITGGVQ